jgi:hypothetical protein
MDGTSTADLVRAMELLGVPGDPKYLMRDHDDDRRRAELLAHLASWTARRAAEAERSLSVDESADLHRRADRNTGRSLDVARLAWVHHTTDDDAARTALGALVELLELRPAVAGDPVLADSLVALREAADRLAVGVRQYRPQ